MAKTIRFGTLEPQSIRYILQYGQNNQVWYPGTPEYPLYTPVWPKQSGLVPWYPRVSPRYPSMAKTIRFGTLVPQSIPVTYNILVYPSMVKAIKFGTPEYPLNTPVWPKQSGLVPWYLRIPRIPIYPSMVRTIRFGTLLSQSRYHSMYSTK